MRLLKAKAFCSLFGLKQHFSLTAHDPLPRTSPLMTQFGVVRFVEKPFELNPHQSSKPGPRLHALVSRPQARKAL
jgi:hypothetical protein